MKTDPTQPTAGPAAAATPSSEQRLREALERISAMPDTALKNGEGEPYTVCSSVVVTPANARLFLEALSPSPQELDGRSEGEEYLVWSNEHRAWWAPNRCGYTRLIDRAGRYAREDAISIARGARGGWEMAGLKEQNPPEIAIPLRDALEQNAPSNATVSGSTGK